MLEVSADSKEDAAVSWPLGRTRTAAPCRLIGPKAQEMLNCILIHSEGSAEAVSGYQSLDDIAEVFCVTDVATLVQSSSYIRGGV